MHICGDEIMAIAALIPFVGVGLAWARSKVAKLRFWER